MSPTGEEILAACLSHFGHLDLSNAALHMAPVRYSPITFAVARMINASFDVAMMSETERALLADVTAHDGRYDLDGGR